MPPPAPTTTASILSTTTPPTTTTPAEAAAMLNRVSVALARSQRLMDSWLPASTPSSTTTPAYDPADTPLTERPERLGVGAILPADGTAFPGRGTGLAGLSKTLGLKMPNKGGAVARKAGGDGIGTRGRGKGDWGEGKEGTEQKGEGEGEGSAEEDEGRTSAVGKRNVGRKNGTDKGGEQKGNGEGKARKKKRGASYLDEMLGARKKKGKMARGDED